MHYLSAGDVGLHSQRNFVGCLRGLYFNRQSVLDRLNTSRVRYHNDGSSPYQGCHAFGSSSLQFTHDGAFARFEHHSASSLRIQLQFRTLRSNSFILYTESSAATPKGYLQVVHRFNHSINDYEYYSNYRPLSYEDYTDIDLRRRCEDETARERFGHSVFVR